MVVGGGEKARVGIELEGLQVVSAGLFEFGDAVGSVEAAEGGDADFEVEAAFGEGLAARMETSLYFSVSHQDRRVSMVSGARVSMIGFIIKFIWHRSLSIDHFSFVKGRWKFR